MRGWHLFPVPASPSNRTTRLLQGTLSPAVPPSRLPGCSSSLILPLMASKISCRATRMKDFYIPFDPHGTRLQRILRKEEAAQFTPDKNVL